MNFTALVALGALAGAQAEVVGVVESSVERIELHDEVGICELGAKRVVHFNLRDKVQLNGCYRIVNGHVIAGFFDGDHAIIPVMAVKKVGSAL